MTGRQRRAQLIETATQLVLEESFHAVSIEAVAKRAGITRAVVYQHFIDLDDLFDAVVDGTLERAYAQWSKAEEPLPAGADARQRMLNTVAVYVEAVRANPEVWRLVLRGSERAPERLRLRLADGREQLLAQMARAVLPILEDTPDPELTASVLSTIADNYARLVLLDPEEFPLERLLEHADWLIGGFLRDLSPAEELSRRADDLGQLADDLG